MTKRFRCRRGKTHGHCFYELHQVVTTAPQNFIRGNMTLDELKQTLCEQEHDDSVVFENPDFADAVVGISEEGRVIYDYDKMVESLMAEDCISDEEAVDFIEYNTIRAIPYMGEKKPIILYRLGE